MLALTALSVLYDDFGSLRNISIGRKRLASFHNSHFSIKYALNILSLNANSIPLQDLENFISSVMDSMQRIHKDKSVCDWKPVVKTAQSRWILFLEYG